MIDVSDKCLIPGDFLRRLVNVFAELSSREDTGKQFYPSSLNNLEWPKKKSSNGKTGDISITKPNCFTPNKAGETDGMNER